MEGASGQLDLRPDGHHQVGEKQRGLYTCELNKVNLQGSSCPLYCRPFFSPSILSHSIAGYMLGGHEFLASVYDHILRPSPLLCSRICFSFEKELQAVISHH